MFSCVSVDGRKPWDAEQQVLSDHTPYGEWAALTADNGSTNTWYLSILSVCHLILISRWTVELDQNKEN